MSKTYKYDVGISFAGEDRDFAFQLAKRCKQVGLSVFYDRWNTVDMWGKSMTKTFSSTYKQDALFVVCLFSKYYNAKGWPQFEFSHMQEREMQEDFVLPISLDNTIPEDWPKTKMYVRKNDYSLDEIILMLRNKVEARRAEVGMDPLENQQSNTMTIFNEDGSTEDVEVVIAFEMKDTKNKYVVYTKQEYDENGDITLYVSRVDQSEGEQKLMGVEDPHEWNSVKEVLYKLSQNEENSEKKLNTAIKFEGKNGVEILCDY